MKGASNNALIALMNNKKDFLIAQNEHWYRIPVENAPKIIKDNQAEYLAFFHTQAFSQWKYGVVFYAKIKNIQQVSRTLLFPEEIKNKKSEKLYYKIEIEPLEKLKNPIFSKIARRWLFVSTTLFRILNAETINDVFNGSPLEEKMWTALLNHKIEAEREYAVTANKHDMTYFYLDFAIFCKDRNINVECNGFHYHGSKEAIRYDKNRNNVLESMGWSVLRFTTEEINSHLDKTIMIVKETINKHGGIRLGDGSTLPMRLDNNNPQLSLF
jgi:very-short-patch-repair endonuclease